MAREVRVRRALVEEHRHLQLRRELELRLEAAQLGVARREVAIEVEPALADGDDLGPRAELAQRHERIGAVLARVVRVDAGRGEEARGALSASLCDLPCALASRHAGSRGDDRHDAGVVGAREHSVEVLAERLVPEVRADVDDAVHRAPPTSFASACARG